MFDDDACINTEKELSCYVINSSKNYGRDLAENAYSEMVLYGRYKDACKWLRLKHQVYGTELENIIIKIFIQRIKDRTECFDDHFPCR